MSFKPYEKIEIEDRIVEYPDRYKIEPLSDNLSNIIAEPGEVTKDGTDINKEFLDHLQDRIKLHDDTIGNPDELVTEGKDLVSAINEAYNHGGGGGEGEGGGGDSEPLGIIKLYLGEVAPEGYAICDGREINVSSYPEFEQFLKATKQIGEGKPYQYGENEETIILPDMSERVPVGLKVNSDYFDELGKTGGSKYLQEHKHTINGTGFNLSYTPGGTMKWIYGLIDNEDYPPTTKNTGEGDSENLQPYYVVNFIVKVKKGASGSGAGGDAEPIGVIKEYQGTTAPDGYLFADGSSFNVASYPELAEIYPDGNLPLLVSNFEPKEEGQFTLFPGFALGTDSENRLIKTEDGIVVLNMTVTGDIVPDAGVALVTIPEKFRPSKNIFTACSLSGAFIGQATVYPSGEVFVYIRSQRCSSARISLAWSLEENKPVQYKIIKASKNAPVVGEVKQADDEPTTTDTYSMVAVNNKLSSIQEGTISLSSGLTFQENTHNKITKSNDGTVILNLSVTGTISAGNTKIASFTNSFSPAHVVYGACSITGGTTRQAQIQDGNVYVSIDSPVQSARVSLTWVVDN